MSLYPVTVAHRRTFWASQQPHYSPRTLDLLPISADDVQFSWGLGVHSTALLLLMVLYPACYAFDIRRLVVVVAQTGSEFADIKALVEEHIFPILRYVQIRVVQVARHGLYKEDGIVVLDDTRNPTTLYIEGDYTLITELMEAGTVPQVAQGKHICAQKYKGEVIDGWVDLWHEGQPYRNILGYHAGEPERMTKAQSYTTRVMAHESPLIEMGWGHQMCLDFIWHLIGIDWVKSCCGYCPFAGGRQFILDRYAAEPDRGIEALLMEYCSMALNGNMTLFGSGKSLYDSVLAQDTRIPGSLESVINGFQQRLDTLEWSIYRIQRIYYERPDRKKRPMTDRNVEIIMRGSRQEVAQALGRMLGEHVEDAGHRRVYTRRRTITDRSKTTIEEFCVAAPAGIVEKQKKRFPKAWAHLALQQRMFTTDAR